MKKLDCEGGLTSGGKFDNQPPSIIAWEITRSCPMSCAHCRAAARNEAYPNELSTEQCFALLDNIAGFSKPIIILTGGEPMSRDDVFDIARHGHKLDLRMVMAPCGAMINDATVERMIDAGIQCISISIDGATAESHDKFRGVSGAFEIAINAINFAKARQLPFQINTTITKHNIDELPAILQLALELGAITFNPFLLVPVGRGRDLAGHELSPRQYEHILQWLSDKADQAEVPIRVTCAPHYQRILRQKHKDRAKLHGSHPGHGHPKLTGCLGGKAFAFISHVGKVQICGFLEEQAGDLKANGFDFADIWRNSELFNRLRDVDSYGGKCGYCEYRFVCGGCRARAFAMTGDYMAAEPFCVHQPAVQSSAGG